MEQEHEEQDYDDDSWWNITPIIVKVEHVDIFPDDWYDTQILQAPNQSFLSPTPSPQMYQQQQEEQADGFSFINVEEQEVMVMLPTEFDENSDSSSIGQDPLAF